MAGEKFIALEETSQEIKESVNDVKTNVDGLKETDVPAIDTLVDAVLERIGLTDDTGGSGITGTVMSKLNELINKFGQSGVEVSTTGEGNTLASFTLNPNRIKYVLYAGMVDVWGIYKVKIDKTKEYFSYGVIQYTENPQDDTFLKLANSEPGTTFSSDDVSNIGSFNSNTEYLIFVPKNSYLLVFIDSRVSTSATYTFTLTYGND